MGCSRKGTSVQLSKWATVSGTRPRVYRGDVDSPKSVRSIRFAALSDGLLVYIDEWRAISLDTCEDALVFPSERLTTPLARDNCWRRGFLPKLTPVGLAWANFQIMRRTHSSLLKELDVDPQVRADQMGHTVDVNENVYTTTSLKRRKEAVNALGESNWGLMDFIGLKLGSDLRKMFKRWSGGRGSNP